MVPGIIKICVLKIWLIFMHLIQGVDHPSLAYQGSKEQVQSSLPSLLSTSILWCRGGWEGVTDTRLSGELHRMVIWTQVSWSLRDGAVEWSEWPVKTQILTLVWGMVSSWTTAAAKLSEGKMKPVLAQGAPSGGHNRKTADHPGLRKNRDSQIRLLVDEQLSGEGFI